MLIQLRQTEIEAALQMYISSQGFNLTGRQVDISFTSGRGNNGISADVDIGDVVSQPSGNTPVGCTPRSLVAVGQEIVAPVTVFAEPKDDETLEEPVAQVQEVEEPQPEVAEEEDVPAKSTSLFG